MVSAVSSGYYKRITNWWSRRARYVAAFETLGSLYDGRSDEFEERAIRSQLRRMGVPVDPVLTDAQVLDEVYWEPDGADNYEARLRAYRVANDVRRPNIVNHPRRPKRRFRKSY